MDCLAASSPTDTSRSPQLHPRSHPLDREHQCTPINASSDSMLRIRPARVAPVVTAGREKLLTCFCCIMPSNAAAVAGFIPTGVSS